ncbi:hypothetical protein [Brachybacterium squillarum]|uniref:hypothetical protein n=1 Tax=Brachybacterium squillarum TaxID=661979 RepID=UPI0022213E94|nr:hypothetical protein [Brachybacterium squillarum]MCW1803735.1 hypothetical protein [Brachybacterium squillarum]
MSIQLDVDRHHPPTDTTDPFPAVTAPHPAPLHHPVFDERSFADRAEDEHRPAPGTVPARSQEPAPAAALLLVRRLLRRRSPAEVLRHEQRLRERERSHQRALLASGVLHVL